MSSRRVTEPEFGFTSYMVETRDGFHRVGRHFYPSKRAADAAARHFAAEGFSGYVEKVERSYVRSFDPRVAVAA